VRGKTGGKPPTAGQWLTVAPLSSESAVSAARLAGVVNQPATIVDTPAAHVLSLDDAADGNTKAGEGTTELHRRPEVDYKGTPKVSSQVCIRCVPVGPVGSTLVWIRWIRWIHPMPGFIRPSDPIHGWTHCI
jgi:hypothetical protein